MEFSWSCVTQTFQTAPASSLPQQQHKQPRNYQPLCERAETDAEDCRHGGSVSPRVRNPRVVPFAPDRISEPGKQEKSTGRVAVLNEPKPRAKPQRGPPKRAEKNQDITNRAMEAGPKNVRGVSLGMINVESGMTEFPHKACEEAVKHKRGLGQLSHTKPSRLLAGRSHFRRGAGLPNGVCTSRHRECRSN